MVYVKAKAEGNVIGNGTGVVTGSVCLGDFELIGFHIDKNYYHGAAHWTHFFKKKKDKKLRSGRKFCQ